MTQYDGHSGIINISYQPILTLINMDGDRKLERKLTILLVGRIYEEDDIYKIIRKIIDLFQFHAPDTTFFLMNKKTKDKMRMVAPEKNLRFEVFDAQLHEKRISFVVTVGGDGTILYGAKEFKSKTPPFLSFQRGTLGFLCKFKIDQIPEIIEQAVKFQDENDEDFPFVKNTLMRIQGKVTGQNGDKVQTKVCLNEMAITRKHYERIILELYVNDEFITETAGDGLLISTPTGSTAYSLSAGGPIIEGSVNSILVVPIAPNSLAFRPICLPASSVIKVKMSPRSRVAGILSFDGQSNCKFEAGDEIEIKKSAGQIVFYGSKSENAMPTWMQRLKYFLGWNQVFKSPKCDDPKVTSKFASNFYEMPSIQSKKSLQPENMFEYGLAKQQ